MPVRGPVGHKWRILALLAMLSLALPLTAAEAVPCDAYHGDGAHLARYRLRVVVAADEEWQRAHGAGAEFAAHQLVREADRILEPTGVDLAFVEYRTWAPAGNGGPMIRLLNQLESSVPAGPGYLVIGLTGRRVSRVDGIARMGHSHLVARDHPVQPEYDALVVAHEIGHLMGAKHHHCHHNYLCVMTPKGFELPSRWCAHHVQEIQLYSARLLAE
jgi:hypothetical protein